jgi:hypothetical protein
MSYAMAPVNGCHEISPGVVKLNGEEDQQALTAYAERQHLPTTLLLSFMDEVVSFKTKGLVLVSQLVCAAKIEFSDLMSHVRKPSINLHITKDTEALPSHSSIAEHAALLSQCAAWETLLIVKCKPSFCPCPNSYVSPPA